tara:strand:+ start:405 stop:773 length:369 start_codon:yes stop_codon:yes gene_type:complete
MDMVRAINQAIAAGYTIGEINHARYSVQRGQNRRYDAVMNLVRNPRPKKLPEAPKAPTQKAAPLAPTNTLVSQLKMGQGGARPAKGKTTPRKTRDLIKTSSYIDPITSTMSATPYGSSLNLA